MPLQIRWIGVTFLAMIVLSACTNVHDEVNQPPAQINEADQLRLEQVAASIELETTKLIPYGISGAGMNLNAVQPAVYSFEEEAAETSEQPEFVYIYMFDSVASLQKGLDDFRKWDADRMTQFPTVFENNNILVVYLSESRDTPRYKEQIKQAMQKLE